MTKAEMRVQIAKDVIKQIAAKKYKATQGSYVANGEFYRQFDSMHKLYDEEAQVKVPKTRCDVCAIGACFLATVDRFDKLKVGDLPGCWNPEYGRGGQVQYLNKWFSPDQLTLMEVAFEKGEVPPTAYKGSDDRLDDAVAYGCQYKTANQRLVAIMRNVIRNKGTFKP